MAIKPIPSVLLHSTNLQIACLSSHALVIHSVFGCLYLFILAKIYIVIYLYKDKMFDVVNLNNSITFFFTFALKLMMWIGLAVLTIENWRS